MHLASNVYAQDELHYVHVELKSGLKIEARLISISYGDSVQLLLPTGKNMVVPWDDMVELDFIDREVNKKIQNQAKQRKRTQYPFHDSAWTFFFDFGTNFGLDYWGDPVMGGTVQTGFHKRISYQTSIGIGTGLDLYLWPDMGVLPVYLEYKGRFRPGSYSWFYYVQAGHGFVPFSEYDNSWLSYSKATGGFYFSPGVGFVNKWKSGRSWYMKFGYKVQHARAEYNGWIWGGIDETPARIEEDIRYYRFDIKLGYEFDSLFGGH